MVEQAADDALPVGGTSQLGLVVPVGGGEDAVQTGGVCLLDGVAGDIESFAQVHGCSCDAGPAGGLRDEELVLVAIGKGYFVGDSRLDRILHLLVKAVR